MLFCTICHAFDCAHLRYAARTANSPVCAVLTILTAVRQMHGLCLEKAQRDPFTNQVEGTRAIAVTWGLRPLMAPTNPPILCRRGEGSQGSRPGWRTTAEMKKRFETTAPGMRETCRGLFVSTGAEWVPAVQRSVEGPFPEAIPLGVPFPGFLRVDCAPPLCATTSVSSLRGDSSNRIFCQRS